MSLKKDSTHELLEKFLNSIQETSPINIQFITQPISDVLSSRIQSLETWYGKSRLYGFLLRKGVYPIVLFTAVTGSLSYGIQRAYFKSTKLVLNLLGVVYPTWRCWRLLKQVDSNTNEKDELKSWLTYWMIFGSFQVLDHWMASDLFPFSRKKYNLYKLFILYWTQNPHSNGAQVLYRHVIQKPKNKEEKEKNEIELYRGSEIINLKEQEEEEEHTISIGYSYLDGYNPPNLLSSTQHNSSEEDDDSERENIHISTVTVNNIIPSNMKSEKETYSLMHTTTEPAW